MQKMVCSQEDNLCSLHASYILLGYFASCLPKWSNPVVEQLTVRCSVTCLNKARATCCAGRGQNPNVIFSMKWCHWHGSAHQLTDKWTVKLPPSERRWAGSMEVQFKCDLWASSCRTSSAQCLSQLSSASSLLVLVAGPIPPSRAEKPGSSSAAVARRGVQAVDSTAAGSAQQVCAGPSTSDSMYATCTMFCHAEELFIIYYSSWNIFCY